MAEVGILVIFVLLLLLALAAFERERYVEVMAVPPERLETLQVGGRGLKFRFRGDDVGLRRLRLRPSLADVLRSRPGFKEFQRRDSLIALGFGSPQRDLSICRLELCDQRARGNAITFRYGHFNEPPTDLRSDTNIRRFDIARRAFGILLRAPAARRSRGCHDDDEEVRRSTSDAHAVRPSKDSNASR